MNVNTDQHPTKRHCKRRHIMCRWEMRTIYPSRLAKGVRRYNNVGFIVIS